MNLRIGIVGYGNIARRYIKIIENILKSNNINFQISVIRSGQNLYEKTNLKL